MDRYREIQDAPQRALSIRRLRAFFLICGPTSPQALSHREQPYNTEYWGYHYVTPSEGDLVQYFKYKTDTKGKDVGNCTLDDAHIKDVVFNPVQVMLLDQ